MWGLGRPKRGSEPRISAPALRCTGIKRLGKALPRHWHDIIAPEPWHTDVAINCTKETERPSATAETSVFAAAEKEIPNSTPALRVAGLALQMAKGYRSGLASTFIR